MRTGPLQVASIHIRACTPAGGEPERAAEPEAYGAVEDVDQLSTSGSRRGKLKVMRMLLLLLLGWGMVGCRGVWCGGVGLWQAQGGTPAAGVAPGPETAHNISEMRAGILKD